MSLRWGLLSTARINDKLLDSGGAEFVAVASRDAGRAAEYAREKGIARAHGSYEDLLAQGQAVVGSPSSVAKRLGELYDDLGGFGQIIGLFAIGPSTHEQVMRSAELFATEVMPVLRPLGNATKATR